MKIMNHKVPIVIQKKRLRPKKSEVNRLIADTKLLNSLIDNNKNYLNSIPFADHGALLDPPTVDVSARCISFLKQLNRPEDKAVINKGLKYIFLFLLVKNIIF